MTIADVVSLLGGIALFLCGMSLMGEGLKLSLIHICRRRGR